MAFERGQFKLVRTARPPRVHRFFAAGVAGGSAAALAAVFPALDSPADLPVKHLLLLAAALLASGLFCIGAVARLAARRQPLQALGGE